VEVGDQQVHHPERVARGDEQGGRPRPRAAPRVRRHRRGRFRPGWGLTAGENVSLIEPQGYFDILVLQENANCILTDSGGMQKEAFVLGVRCITLREETEWVETVSSGWNRLTGVEPDAIRAAFETWHPQGERPALYGDGHSAEQICEILLRELK